MSESIRFSNLFLRVSGETMRKVYACYAEGMSIENIGALFEIQEEEVNEIIDAINC